MFGKLKGMQPSSHPSTFTEAAEVFLTLLLLKIFLRHSDRQEQFSNRGLNVNMELIILCARKEKLQRINQVLQHRLIYTYQFQIFCEIIKKCKNYLYDFYLINLKAVYLFTLIKLIHFLSVQMW